MGNNGSTGGSARRRSHNSHHHQRAPPPSPPFGQAPPLPAQSQPQAQPQQQQPPEVASANRYVFAAATPYPPQYPNPNPPQYYQPPYGYYPPPPPAMPVPLPAPFDHHHRGGAEYPAHHHPAWMGGGRYPPYGPPMPAAAPPPYVEHQKAVTIRNDVNIKKESLRIEPDEQNPGRFLVAFTFDATVAGSITVFFFAKEGVNCSLTATKPDILEPVTVSFKEGLGQKFKQPSGTGIDFSVFDSSELMKEGDADAYPLAVKAEASPFNQESVDDDQKVGSSNAQITQALFEKKDNGEYHIRVAKQILWVNGTRYELQEIYGIGNAVDADADGNDPGKECVICLSEPRDTTVLPCRHMCMCSECAKVLRFQTNRCPICRQPVERLLEIKVNNRAEEQQHLEMA